MRQRSTEQVYSTVGAPKVLKGIREVKKGEGVMHIDVYSKYCLSIEVLRPYENFFVQLKT